MDNGFFILRNRRLKMKFVKTVAILVAMLTLANAQNGKIIGLVTDQQTGDALVETNILLENLNVGTATDENGEFVFENVPYGKYLISASYMGYRVFKKEIRVQSSETVKIDIKMVPIIIPGQEVVIVSTRAKVRETPVVFSNISEEYIKDNYTVQDIPMLLTEIPNVYSYSDAGNPMGYTYMKVRGFDQTRVGVMINGIPLNDPEDHQVYWVDMPDFAENVQDIQLQRGVGSSIYGSSTFGGSLNLITNQNIKTAGSDVFCNFGSYQTRKYGAKINTGLINNSYQVNFRFSRMLSDGYRENSGSDMIAYFAAINYYGKKSVAQLNIYGGNENTHAAWYASPQDALEKNHRDNPIEYPNTIDNFSQPHFELHYSYKLNERINLNNTIFYIHGKGYYEAYKSGRNLWEYGLIPIDDGNESDVIRQKWVEKNQYGWVGQAILKHHAGELTFGTYLSTYDSDHWGEVDWVEANISGFLPDFRYYQYFGKKYYLTAYANEIYHPIPQLSAMVNLYFQHIDYKFWHGEEGNFTGALRNEFKVKYDFFNPRFGLNYNLSRSLNIFGNVSFAQREPADNELYDTWDGPDDLGKAPLFSKPDTVFRNGKIDKVKWSDPVVKPEELLDLEFGAGYVSKKINLKLNFFWMNLSNEIIPYGQVNDDGYPIRGNADETIHRGIETSLRLMLPKRFEFNGNFSYNDNYFKKFIFYDYDWNQYQAVAHDFGGNQIAGFPQVLANMRLTYRLPSFTASVRLQHVGKQYLDNTENEDRTVPAHNILNANLVYSIGRFLGSRNLQLSIHFNNILNEKYFSAGYYDSWEGKNFYWPGAEYNWIAGLRLSL